MTVPTAATLPVLGEVERAEVLDELEEIVLQLRTATNAVQRAAQTKNERDRASYDQQWVVYTEHAKRIAERLAKQLRGARE